MQNSDLKVVDWLLILFGGGERRVYLSSDSMLERCKVVCDTQNVVVVEDNWVVLLVLHD